MATFTPGQTITQVLALGYTLYASGQAAVKITDANDEYYVDAVGSQKFGPYRLSTTLTLTTKSAGIYTLVYEGDITATTPAIAAPITQADTQTDAGLGAYHQGDYVFTYSPQTTPSQTIMLGRRDEYLDASTFNNSGVGHSVAHLSWYRKTGTGNPSLAIADEAKIDNEVNATISNGKFYEGQMSSNVGTISTLTGSASRITGNAGTVTLFIGYEPSIFANAGTVGTFYGFRFPAVAVSGVTTKLCLINEDANAPIVSAAPIIDQSINYASPSATGQTVSVPARKQLTLITPAAGYAAMTLQMPPKASVYDGQKCKFVITQAVTTPTFDGNGAAFVFGGPTSLTAGQSVEFTYFQAIDWWVRSDKTS